MAVSTSHRQIPVRYARLVSDPTAFLRPLAFSLCWTTAMCFPPAQFASTV